MSDMYELIKSVWDKRMSAVETQRALVASVEAAGGTWSEEDDATNRKISADIDALGARVDSLLDTAEQTKHVEEQRARFEGVIQPDSDTREERDTESKLRSWLHAALPQSETWAPRGLQFKISTRRPSSRCSDPWLGDA